MRKPICLAILGISIVVAAVSLGVTLTRYVSLLAYSPMAAARATATPVGPGVPAPPPEEWNNLFAPGDGMKLASRLPAVDPNAPSVTTRSDFVLVGTIVSSSPEARRAILWANGMNEPKAFRVKEEIAPGAFLSSVERDAAWITRGNGREKLELLPVGSSERSTAAGASAVASRGGSAASRPPPSPGAPPRPGAVLSSKKPPGIEDGETQTPQERRRRLRRNLR